MKILPTLIWVISCVLGIVIGWATAMGQPPYSTRALFGRSLIFLCLLVLAGVLIATAITHTKKSKL